MANSLLDFVMSLVRDSDAAARYAADPAAAIAHANLPDVTSADVDQLIPVVAESLSSAAPGLDATSWAATVPAVDANVWTSGAATAAFDAFGIDDSVPVIGLDDVPGLDDLPVHDVSTITDDGLGVIQGLDEEYADIPVSTVVEDLPVHDGILDHEWSAAPDASGFDVFD
ncbi:Rv0340 family IniB-related protein [Mycolicibacterium frederiksbergense]|uniref:Rv0340 family IniB-related protein n=1 Tax=Mycolicibacterium frederiksbergense TaxID=117567 RepID=UPI00399A8AC4